MNASDSLSLKRIFIDENNIFTEEVLQKRAHVEQVPMFYEEEESSSEEVAPARKKRDRTDDRDCDFLIRKMAQVSFNEKLVLNEVNESGGMIISKKSVALEIHPDISLGMSDDEFVTICRECHYATRLTIPQAKNITDSGIVTALTGRTNMYEINMAYCQAITDWAMLHIGTQCPGLYSFSLLSCPITDDGISLLTGKCQRLRVLHLDWCNLTDHSLEAIARNCPLLKEFTADEGTQFSLNGFYTLVRGCPNLERLELGNCTQVNNNWMYALIDSQCNIKELDISGCPLITQDVRMHLEARFKGIKITPYIPLAQGAAVVSAAPA